MLVCVLLGASCTRARGCSAHPAFPAPSSFWGEEFMHHSGASRREVADLRIKHGNRHCERSEAIHSLSLCLAMDCFAPLAMTAPHALPILTARQRHDFIRGRTGTCDTHQFGETTPRSCAVRPFDDDAAIGGPPEPDPRPRLGTPIFSDPPPNR